MMPTQQQPWNQHTLQQPSSFQESRKTADELNTQKPAHHRQNLHTAAQQQTSATVVVSSTSHTRDQIDKEWTEHKAPSGMSYYYNSLTKESTFQRPPALATEVPIQAPSAQTQQPTEKVWVEYTDPSTGKKYYSDGQTTSWNKPEGFGAAGTIHHSTLVHSTKAEPEVAETTDSTSVDKKKKRANNSAKRETPFLSKAEATAAFKGMLLAKGIAPNLKWHEVVKLCSSDKRWDDCEDSLTLGERKQALAEYQTKRANELRTMERQERIRAKEAFQQLLTAVLPSSPSFHASTSRFSDIRDVLSKDDRFYAVQDEDIRESLFLDFCEEVRKREDRNRNNKKRECKDAFLAFLREQEEQNILTFASTW
jgi:pre-mRNA-processing factor 40